MGKNKYISVVKRLNILTENLSKRTTQGTYFKIKLDNSSNLINMRNNIDASSYGQLLKGIQPDKLGVGAPILGTRRVKIKELFQNVLHYGDFESEFFWARSIVNENIGKINVFLKLKDEYSNNLLLGKYDEAEVILKQIENEFGFSIWLIKNRISFYQISDGLERQKKFVNKIKKEFFNGSLTKFIVHWISVRNENSTTIGRYKNQIEQVIGRLEPNKYIGIGEFLNYHLLENELSSPEDLIHVVRLSYSTSIIDYYESFLSLLKAISLDVENVHYDKSKSFVASHFDIIDDYRLRNVAFLNNIEGVSIEYDYLGVDIYNDLLCGEIAEGCNKLKNELVKENESFSTILLYSYAKSLVASSFDFHWEGTQENLLAKITTYLSAILKYGVIASSKEYFELNKIMINFSNFQWSSTIKLILAKEMSILENVIGELDGEVINSRSIHPFMMEFISNKTFGDIYESKCKEVFLTNPSFIFHNALRNLEEVNIPDISENFKNYVNSLVSYKSENFEKSINLAAELKKNGTEFYIRKANSLISYSYIYLKRIKTACEFVAKIYVEDRNQYPFLPIEYLSEHVKPSSSQWRECESSIDLPIIFDAYSKHYKEANSKRIANTKRYSYEDFLTSLDIDRPSKLKSVDNYQTFEKNKLIYYLRFICLESIMDLSGNFDGGSEEVVEERLQICRLLLEIDPNNELIYKEEISDIVRRQVIASRRQEVDQSRVYVDIKSIKEWAATELDESFYRFISYIKSGLSNFSQKELEEKRKNSAIYTPEDETSDLLVYMIDTIRTSYLSSDIGLDRFISTRIRHGELERTMRIPIQRHQLITKKQIKTGPYFSNDYWLDKLNDTEDSETKLKIDSAFKVFSENFDALISEIANEWLQIKSIDKPNGLFDFTIPSEDIQKIAKIIAPETTLEYFIDMIINSLDNLLIFILIKIREKLNSEGKESAKRLLRELDADIFENSKFANMELSRAINQARTDLTAQFDKVIEWFVPSAEGNSAPYTIDDAILVAEAIIKEANSNFKVTVNSDNENYSIHGQLPIFVDIFINIFENVVKRSGLEYPEATIKLHVEDFDEMHFEIKINVSNELGENIDILEVKKTLDLIKEKMTKDTYSKYVAKDKNSGLLKIFKSINDLSVIDADLKASMDFEIIERKFEMNLSVPFKMVRLQQIEEQKIVNYE